MVGFVYGTRVLTQKDPPSQTQQSCESFKYSDKTIFKALNAIGSYIVFNKYQSNDLVTKYMTASGIRELYVKYGGTWTNNIDAYAKVSGNWLAVKSVFVKVSGTWVEVYAQ